MPVYIGDYLADTMHLTTEQHGAYLLLIFHLWRRGSLPDDNTVLAKIAGLDTSSWRNTRPVLAEFFKIEDKQWRHGRVERERIRVAAKQETYAKKAKSAARKRWKNDAPSIASSIAPSIALLQALHCSKQCLGHSSSIARRCRTRTTTRTRVFRKTIS